MAKLTARTQHAMFKQLDTAMMLDFGETGVPMRPEEARLETFEALLKKYEADDKAHVAVCVYYLLTLTFCMNPVPNEKIAKLSVRIVSAFRNGAVTLQELPMDEVALALAWQDLADSHIELQDRSASAVDDVLSYGRELVAQGLLDKRIELRSEIAWDVFCGRFALAQQKIEEFLATPRTENSDCEGCELNALIHAYIAMGNLDKAKACAEEI
ncbi:MAG: hypothetical protein LBD12_06135, partial [Clostridiales Family XIII bacterium]|nr:hypothetical protein [Clostridiales Family XIII bacterium]